MDIKSYNLAYGSTVAGICSKFYEGIGEEFVKGYAWDLLLPIAYYNTMTLIFDRNSKLNKNPSKAAIILGGPVVFETAQYIGWYPGHFDWNDLVAYTVGTIAAVSIYLMIFQLFGQVLIDFVF